GGLTREGGGWRFRAPDLDLPLSAESLQMPDAALELALDGEARFGLRPEHLRLVSADGGIPGRVQLLEPVGSDLYLTVEAAGTTLQVRTDPDAAVSPGDNLTLTFDPARSHLFASDGTNARFLSAAPERIEPPVAVQTS